MALGQLGAVRAMDQGDVGEGGHVPAQGLVDQRLSRGVVEVVVAADDVGDAHVVVVGDHGEIVGRRAVGAQQHQVVEVAVLEHHPPLHQIVDHRLAVQRPRETDDVGAEVGAFPRLAAAPGGTQGVAVGAGLLAGCLEFVGGHVAAVGAARGQQLVHHGLMALHAGILEGHFAVGLQPHPVETVEDGLHGGVGGARPIGVFDPQQELAAGVFRVKVVEQSRAGAAYMQGTCGGRGETGDDGLGVGHRDC